MSILSDVKNFVIEKFGIDKNTTDKNAVTKTSNKTQNVSMVSSDKIEKNVDTFKSGEVNKVSTQKNEKKVLKETNSRKEKHKETVGETKQQFENTCKKHGFDPQKPIQKILKDLNPQTEKDKILAYKCAEFTVKMVHSFIEAGKISSRKDISETAKFLSKLTYQAMQSGQYDNFEEFEADLEKYYSRFQKIDKNEKDNKLKEVNEIKNEVIASKNEEINNAKKLPKERREIALKQIEQKYQAIENGIFHIIVADMKPNEAIDYITIGNVNSLDENMQAMIETNASIKDKQAAADSVTHAKKLEIIQGYKEQGTPVDSEVLKRTTKVHFSYKTQEAMYQYQQDMTDNRVMFENAKAKKANGEALTPEEEALLGYMQDDYYTFISQGVGEGVIENRYVSNDAKAEFIAKWDSDAKKFDDYEQVTNTVNQELAKNPILKDKVEAAKEVLKEQENTIKEEKNSSSVVEDNNQQVIKKNEKQIVDNDAHITYSTKPSNFTNKLNIINDKKEEEKKIITSDATKEQILEMVKKGEIENYNDLKKACKSTSKLTKMVLSSSELENYIPQLIEELKNISKDNLMYLLRGMSEKNILKIAKELNLTSNEIEKMTNRKLSYTTREVLDLQHNDCTNENI